MSNENGGPAFPYSGVHKGEKENHIIDSHGMLLRDYFAAKAMQGEMSKSDGYETPSKIANYAYQVADAMLLARGQ